MKTVFLVNGSMVKKPHLIKNEIRRQCNTENFVPIVVPGLSSSSSGSSSTLRTPMKQESHSSSSSSSSSPTVSEIQTREREDQTESDISPAPVSTTVDERSGRPDDNEAKKTPKRNPRGNRATRCVLKSRSGCKNSGKFWWMTDFLNTETHTPVLLMKRLLSPYSRDVRIWVSTVFILISLKTEIARSVNGPKLQGPVQKTQWRSRTSSRKFW